MEPRSRYVYQHLPADSIRLLQLHPGSGDEVLVCELFSVTLDAGAVYEAISYVWGDPKHFTTLECDAKVLQIGQNLGESLHRVRLPDKPRILWADAICISVFNIPSLPLPRSLRGIGR